MPVPTIPAIPAASSSWIKASLSFANGNCVELQPVVGGGVRIRDSKDPEGPVLIFTQDEWDAFSAGVKAGEFDSLHLDALSLPPAC